MSSKAAPARQSLRARVKNTLQRSGMVSVSRQDARQHLTNIGASKGLDSSVHIPQAIVRDLEAAVKVLSDQLYQKSTHFLLELIQNADDNHYEVDEPTLHLTYAKPHLRVDCNEVGFSPKDIDAICSIGQSSKAGAGVSTQYVGEKGIGFKSVFKAADVIWVSSREYEFKFDKNARLGMVAPILADFPAPKRAKWTSFYLQLAQNYNAQELISDLQSLDAYVLIFLRRLRTINVTIVGQDNQMSTKTLTKTNGLNEGREAIHLSQNDKNMSYIIMRHRARNLPAEPKREGVSESELLLAFPVDEHNEPKVDPQQVFAFLPIRDYGFKFLIQADFLLIASREDVDNSSAWNQALRDKFVGAFLESVRIFNAGSLRYSWSRFLPAKPTASDFFSPLKSRILESLASERILEAWNKELLPASKLIYIPEKYKDDQGMPLTLIPSKEDVYLSHNYSHDDYENLKLLGVVEMGDSSFLDHLEHVTGFKYRAQYFLKRSPEWHSRLATVLAELWRAPQTESRRRLFRFSSLLEDSPRIRSIGKRHSKHRSSRAYDDSDDDDHSSKFQERIMKLPLIQLRNGQWICGEGNTVFFPGDSESWEIPGGINLLVADPEAAKDLPRKHLLQLLGVKDFKITSITQLIVASHSDASFDPEAVARSDLISHIHFLYTTGWRNMDDKPFWFATESDVRALGKNIYLDDAEVTLSASKFFANNRKKYQFIHPDYLKAHPQDPKGWLQWLKANMSLSNIPRLIRPIREVAPKSWTFELSPDFEFVIKSWSALDALTLLCDHWLIYQFWIDLPAAETLDASVEASYRTLKQKISAMMVECTNGKSCRLDETFVPVGDVLQEAAGCVSFLDVRDPEHHRWQHLAHFGVGIKQDVNFYLRCLEKMSRAPCELKQVTYFYEQIQARSNEDRKKVQKFFNDNRNMVYVPFSRNAEDMPDRGAWFSLGQCLWEGPKCMKIYFSMNGIYPSCKRLFTDVLEISDASMKELIFEAVLFKASDELEYMRDVYLVIEKFVENDKTYTVRLQSLSGPDKNIWPISNSMDAGEFDQMLSTATEWFIADTEPLRESFSGIVPLLAFATDDIGQMERLINGLEMDAKRLSRATKSVPRTEGRVARHPELSQAFQSKYEFIARLVQPSTVDRKRRKRVLMALQNTEIFSAEHIMQRYLVKFGDKEVEGRQRPGNVVLTPEEESLKIYLKEQYLETERNPYEFVEKLASFTGIEDRKNGVFLLNMVITEPNPNKILLILAHYGVPMSYPDDDAEDEWLNGTRRPNMPFPDMLEGALPHLYSTESLTIITSDRMRGAILGEDDDATGVNGAFPGDLMTDGPLGRGIRIVAANNRLGRPGGMGGPPVDEALEFIGEKFVADKLKVAEGGIADKFLPEEHWTSNRRVGAGHSPPTDNMEGMSAFTFKDTNGFWTENFARSGIPQAGAWRTRPPTWHVEVKTTRGPLGDEIALSTAQFEKARKFSVYFQEEQYRIPTDVMLLVRVFNAETEPQWAIFLDPWEMYLSGKLRLKSSGAYFGRVCSE